MEFLLLLLFWFFCGVAAGFVASQRGANGCLWMAIGMLLGPLGLFMAFASSPGSICPHCRKAVDSQATKCPYCQSSIGSPAIPPSN